MTNLDLSGAIGAGAKAVREYPGVVYAQAHVATPHVSEAVIRAALPHILEALATEAQAETFDDAVWCRCVSETDPADCSECTPRLSSNWIRAKAEEARA